MSNECYEADDWFAVSWHGHDWTILEWDILRRDAINQDPRFGDLARDFIETNGEGGDYDIGGYIAVNPDCGYRGECYPDMLGYDGDAFIPSLEDIYYLQINGPFANEYNAQYFIDGRIIDDEEG